MKQRFSLHLGSIGGASFLTVILLAIAIAVGIYLIQNPQILKSRADFSVLQRGNKVSLSLSPFQGTANRGCDFTVDVLLDTAGRAVIGTDVILRYDKTRLEAVSVERTSYDLTGVNLSGEIVNFSVLRDQADLNGKQNLAKVTFRVLSDAPDGLGYVVFDFNPINKESTTDTNVVQGEPVMEVLESVDNGEYIIGNNDCRPL